MAKENNMTQAEIKAVAKAVGASLTSQGHAVPHTAVLHALAAALGKNDWQTLKAAVPAKKKETLLSGATRTTKRGDTACAQAVEGPEVPAVFRTFDREFEVRFDAQAYLAQASDEALLSILGAGYSHHRSVDRIAEFFNDKSLNGGIQAGFEHLGARQGFECAVDGQAFLRWMNQHRHLVLARELCEQADVQFVQAEEDEIRGMWDWLHTSGKVCDRSFDSEEDAILDACEVLGLFKKALESAPFVD